MEPILTISPVGRTTSKPSIKSAGLPCFTLPKQHAGKSPAPATLGSYKF